MHIIQHYTPQTMILPVVLAQLPLGALYTLQPESWSLPLGIGEGCMLYMYADCYPQTTYPIALLTFLRTFAVLLLTQDALLIANTLAGIAIGLFLGNCVAGGDRDGEVCLGCLAMRWWDGGKGRAREWADSARGWSWIWEWDDGDEEEVMQEPRREPRWVWDEPF